MKDINWVPNKDIDYDLVKSLLEKSIETGQFTNYGPNVKLLEEMSRNFLEIDDTMSLIAVANASMGIQVLAKAIDYYEKKSIKWATQSFTFPPSNQGTLSNSTVLDIDLDGGLNLDEVNNEIEGLIITNIFGNVVDIDKYTEYCKNNNKYLIFDNAATPYTFYKNKNCSNYGDGSVISFHHTKPLGFGEGGLVIVNKKYETTVRKLINFGIDLTKNYYDTSGNNYKMSDLSASFIIQYLKNNFFLIKEKHILLYNYFIEKIEQLNAGIEFYPSFHDKNIPSCFCLLFKGDLSVKIENLLKENNIFSRKYYKPLKNTKNSLIIYNKILCIPCQKDMTLSDIDNIILLIKSII